MIYTHTMSRYFSRTAYCHRKHVECGYPGVVIYLTIAPLQCQRTRTRALVRVCAAMWDAAL